MGGGCIAQRCSILVPLPVTPGLFLTIPKIYFSVAEIYQRPWLEASGQRLENADWTHLVLASGKVVLQKRFYNLGGPGIVGL